jgi:arsenite methyltransferase
MSLKEISPEYNLIQSRYGDYAKSHSDDSKQFTEYNERVASAFGYSAEDLASIPTSANLGVSCGNPLGTANLKEVLTHTPICTRGIGG